MNKREGCSESATPASDYTAQDLAFKLEVMATNIELFMPMGEVERRFLRSAAAHLRLSAQSENAAINTGHISIPAEREEAHKALERAVKWILTDADYKPPEEIGDIPQRWIDRLREVMS